MFNIKKVTLCTEEEYFSRPDYFGSSDFMTVFTEGIDVFAAEIMYKKLYKGSSSSTAFMFGHLAHSVFLGQKSIDDYGVSETETTTKTGFAKGLMGKKDFVLLKFLQMRNNLNFEAVEKNSEIFEIEQGRFIDIDGQGGENYCVRIKPDLLFKEVLSNELVIIDFKTASKFAKTDFLARYKAQAIYYSCFASKIHACETVRFVNVYFLKEAPFTVHSTTHIFDAEELARYELGIFNSLSSMNEVLRNPEAFIENKHDIDDEVLTAYLV